MRLKGFEQLRIVRENNIRMAPFEDVIRSAENENVPMAALRELHIEGVKPESEDEEIEEDNDEEDEDEADLSVPSRSPVHKLNPKVHPCELLQPYSSLQNLKALHVDPTDLLLTPSRPSPPSKSRSKQKSPPNAQASTDSLTQKTRQAPGAQWKSKPPQQKSNTPSLENSKGAAHKGKTPPMPSAETNTAPPEKTKAPSEKRKLPSEKEKTPPETETPSGRKLPAEKGKTPPGKNKTPPEKGNNSKAQTAEDSGQQSQEETPEKSKKKQKKSPTKRKQRLSPDLPVACDVDVAVVEAHDTVEEIRDPVVPLKEADAILAAEVSEALDKKFTRNSLEKRLKALEDLCTVFLAERSAATGGKQLQCLLKALVGLKTQKSCKNDTYQKLREFAERLVPLFQVPLYIAFSRDRLHHFGCFASLSITSSRLCFLIFMQNSSPRFVLILQFPLPLILQFPLPSATFVMTQDSFRFLTLADLEPMFQLRTQRRQTIKRSGAMVCSDSSSVADSS